MIEGRWMGVCIRFYANIRQLMGKDEIILNLDPSRRYTVRDVLEEIVRSEHKELSTMLIEVEEKARGTVRILVNGDEVRSLDGAETTVRDGDRITIFPLLGGG
jgi:molybdopterin synthase sulfur carrier subunit